MKLSASPRHPHTRAFTLVEILLAATITFLLILALMQMLSNTQNAWTRTKSQSEAYREARTAFESISRQLSQATLNNYWDYDNPDEPKLYVRQSELHYVSGPAEDLLGRKVDAPAGHAVFFQTTAGLNDLKTKDEGYGLNDTLNAIGFYVSYNSDIPFRPSFMRKEKDINPERMRFRLMEYRLPSEKFNLYEMPPGAKVGDRPLLAEAEKEEELYDWFKSTVEDNSQPLAENILAIFLEPVFPSTSRSRPNTPLRNYLYDTRVHQTEGTKISTEAAKSRHQLPPVIKLVVVALNEGSWNKMSASEANRLSITLKNQVNNIMFKRPSQLDRDIKSLSGYLNAQKLEHRIFSTSIPIRAARWHTEKNVFENP